MKIVLKWNFKTLFSDIPRLALTVCGIAVTYAIIIGMGLSLASSVTATGSMNEGLANYVVSIVTPILQTSFAATLFVLFAVTLAERKNQIFILRSTGCTRHQLILGLITESLAIDVAGMLPGMALGVFVAWSQAKTAGYPLDMGSLFGETVFLRGILPAFLLVPAVMLLASTQLFRKKSGKRQKPQKKNRPPFKKRWFPRLFGAGGTLEYTLGRHERRHRAAIVCAVVFNLGILFMLATGVSVLSGSTYYASSPEEEQAYVILNYRTSSPLGDRLSFTETLLSSLEQNELCDHAVTEIYSSSGYIAIMDAEDLFLEVPSSEDPSVVYKNEHLYRINDGRYFVPYPLAVIEDSYYDQLASALNVKNTGTGCIVVNEFKNETFYNENDDTTYSVDCTILRRLPEQLTLYKHSDAAIELYRTANVNHTYDLQADAETLLKIEDGPLVLSIDGFADSTVFRDIKIGFNFPGIFLSRSYFQSLLQNDAIPQYDYSTVVHTIPTNTPEELCEELKTAFEAEDIQVLQRQFNDGEGYLVHLNEVFTQDAVPENTVVLTSSDIIQDQFESFLQQTVQLFRFFAVAIFMAIALNIVNIVHMNRLSRKQEYAILTSLGLSGRQRMGMQLYESFVFTLRVTLFSIVALIVFVRAFIWASIYEKYEAENLVFREGWALESKNFFDESFWRQIWLIIVNVIHQLRPYWGLALAAVIFLFVGYTVTEFLVNRRMDKEDIIPILKDDMHE